jgi:multiple sugar transport system substrate-binding protein
MRVNRRQLLKASAAGLATAAQFPTPLIARAKPFAGVTLRGASYQHPFLTILQGYIPEFEQQTGMKVDLRLSAFPVYNQKVVPTLTSDSSSFDFLNVTY